MVSRTRVGLPYSFRTSFASLLLILGPAATHEAAWAQARIDRANFALEYEDISQEQAEEFANQTDDALAFVLKFLKGFYGMRRPILIKVSDEFIIPHGDYETVTVTVPAHRIRGDSPGPASLRQRGPAIAHEISHVLAKSFGHPSRYLDEGLGVYLQDVFEGLGATRSRYGVLRSYPNMGIDLHIAMRFARHQ